MGWEFNYSLEAERWARARGRRPPNLKDPQIVAICHVTFKYHLILLSLFTNMCISNEKAEQNNLWSQATADRNSLQKK